MIMAILFAFYYIVMFSLIPVGVVRGGNQFPTNWLTFSQVVLIVGCVMLSVRANKHKNSGYKVRNGLIAYSIATFVTNVCIAWWPR